jgi:hypothetical protein
MCYSDSRRTSNPPILVSPTDSLAETCSTRVSGVSDSARLMVRGESGPPDLSSRADQDEKSNEFDSLASHLWSPEISNSCIYRDLTIRPLLAKPPPLAKRTGNNSTRTGMPLGPHFNVVNIAPTGRVRLDWDVSGKYILESPASDGKRKGHPSTCNLLNSESSKTLPREILPSQRKPTVG